MSGRSQPQPRTRFARVGCSDPGVTVIRISGSLGPRAKPQLVRLTQECLRRNVAHLVLDLSEVDALGGGTARLLNEFAAERNGRGGKTAFRVASRTVRGFLCADPNLPPPALFGTVEEAVASVRGLPAPAVPAAPRKLVVSPPSFVLRPPRSSPLLGQIPHTPDVGMPSLFVPEDDAPRPKTESVVLTARDFLQDESDADVFDLDLDSIIEDDVILLPQPAAVVVSSPAVTPPGPQVSTPGPRVSTPEELRERLVASLHDKGVASRVFIFQCNPDGRYYLVTRQGVDFERAFDSEGALASSVGALRGPGFLVDLDVEALSEVETELLGELNCEVAMPLGRGERPEYLVFVSKERAGDEYTLEELQELEAALTGAQERVARGAEPAVLRAEAEIAVPVARKAPEVAKTRILRAPDVAPPPSRPSDVRQEPWRNADLLQAPARPADRLQAPSRTAASPVLTAVKAAKPTPTSGPLVAAVEPSVMAPTRGLTGSYGVQPSQPVVLPLTPDAGRSLRRTVAQMRDILSISQDFDAAFGTSKLLEVLVLSVVSVARAETVLFFALRDTDYRLTHHRGMSPDSIQGLRLRSDSSLVLRTLSSTRGLLIADDAQVTEEERIWARQHGLHYAVPFRYKDEVLGLLLLGESSDGGAPDLDMLASLLAQAGLAYDRAHLYELLQDRTLGVVRGLVTLIESRNGFDCGSTELVVRYTQALARELQFPTEGLRDLVFGAVLRDVGMLQVSEALLRSASDLSGDQWESIRRHPQEGAAIMRQMRFNPVAIDVVLHHHEAYNGEGYPMGLRGRSIPLGARIVAVAESYVKMTMDRPYRKALGTAAALESLAENWGLRYDPLVVDALVRVVNRELSMGLKGDRDLARDLFGV